MGRKRKERKGYFYEEQEDAVIRYVQSKNEEEKERIYNNILYPAFCKMIESIINRYKLLVPDEDFQETFDDTLSFLMTKISYFNPESGYKAYSYCGTVCKNYLIWKIKAYTKNLKRIESYEDVQVDLDNSIKISYVTNNEDKNAFHNVLIKKTAKNIESTLDTDDKLTDKEKLMGHVLIELLNNWEEIADNMGSNKFNKSSILLYLKENTLMTTTEIRNAMKKFKMTYFDTKESLLKDY